MWLDKTKKGFSFQDKEKRRNTNKKSKKKALLLTSAKPIAFLKLTSFTPSEFYKKRGENRVIMIMELQVLVLLCGYSIFVLPVQL